MLLCNSSAVCGSCNGGLCVCRHNRSHLVLLATTSCQPWSLPQDWPVSLRWLMQCVIWCIAAPQTMISIHASQQENAPTALLTSMCPVPYPEPFRLVTSLLASSRLVPPCLQTCCLVLSWQWQSSGMDGYSCSNAAGPSVPGRHVGSCRGGRQPQPR